MITFAILASILALSHCLPEHPLVVEGENGDDYNAKEISELLKQLMGRAAFEGNHVEVEQARLGFSWSNCGKISACFQTILAKQCQSLIAIQKTISGGK